jgi:serine/threonine-protein kinase RsbW/stage II sporulation protein AB (anti-sigma F factor)
VVKSEQTQRLRLDQVATRDSAAALRHAVLAVAADVGLAGEQRENLEIAVSEAVANVIEHAYRDAPQPGRIYLEAYTADDELSVVVRDEGCGMAPRVDSPGLGLGLPLMSRLTDSLQIERGWTAGAREGVTVRLAFALGATRAG